MKKRTWIVATALLASASVACGQTTRAATQPIDPAMTAKLAQLGSTGLPLHDPSSIVRCKNEYWIFSTGNGLLSFRSTDAKTWRLGAMPVLATPPSWVHGEVPGNKGNQFWAPDVIALDGRYFVYYAVSSWGKNQSAVALMENATLDPDDANYKWIDRGVVVRSTRGDNYNAIDPAVTLDADGRLWLSFGSFWGGIQLVELDRKTGLRMADAPIRAVAWNKEIEAPAIYAHGDRYYLFVTWGLCCRGAKSTYHIRVGRSDKIEGPYVDRDGVELAKGGGTTVVDRDGAFVGPGHPSFFTDADGRERIAMHFYDLTHEGRGTLAIRPLTWDGEGWPRAGDANDSK